MQFLTKFLVSSQGLSKSFSSLNGLMSSNLSSGLSLFFLFFLLVIFLVALSFGKTRIFLALIATYIAVFLESIFWYRPTLEKSLTNFLKLPASFWSHLVVFVFFFVISFLILSRSILKPKMSLQESPPVTILFLSILLGIFWIAIVTSYLPTGTLTTTYPLAKQYLALPSVKFAVACLPLIVLLFFRRKRSVLD